MTTRASAFTGVAYVCHSRAYRCPDSDGLGWRGVGCDAVVVASLNESTYRGCALSFPGPGFWAEVFNSDVYDNWVNPIVAGKGSGVNASGSPMHGLPCSASIVIPANGILVFASDSG